MVVKMYLLLLEQAVLRITTITITVLPTLYIMLSRVRKCLTLHRLTPNTNTKILSY